MSEWNPEANEIFLNAIDCESSKSRQAYLDEVCGSDGDLRAQVELLLEADSKAGSFLGRPVAGDLSRAIVRRKSCRPCLTRRGCPTRSPGPQTRSHSTSSSRATCPVGWESSVRTR